MPPAPAAPPAALPPAPAKPTAAPSPAPPPPIPTREKPPADYLGNIVGELAEMDAASPAPPAPKPRRDERGQFRPAEKAGDETKPPKDETKPPADETKPPGDATPPGDGEPPKPVRAAELRTAYDGLKKKVSEELQPTIQRLEAKIKEYETKAPEASAPILAKIKTLEEENTRLKQVAEVSDYRENPAYQKAESEYAQAWTRATNAFSQLTIKEQTGTDGETGEPIYTPRRAGEADLIELGKLSLSDLDEAAQRMFGASAPRAIQYIERLRDLAESKQQAEHEAKTKIGEWKGQKELEIKTRQANQYTLWSDINKALEEKYPGAYQANTADADDVASHTKGFALANLLFSPAALTPEQIEALPPTFRESIKAGKQLTDAQKVQLDALSRLKIANHDRKVAALKKANARIAELEKTLSEYEKSEPSTERAGSTPRAPELDLEAQAAAEIRAMDK